MVDVVEWPPGLQVHYSTWDRRVHAYEEIGAMWAEAICRSVTQTDHLRAPAVDDPSCRGCIEVLAMEPERLDAPE